MLPPLPSPGPRAGLACDVAVVGAGAAGIAAARALARAGQRVLVLEARSRPGGRAWTRELAGTGIDLGAHWLHSVRANPLMPLARAGHHKPQRAAYGFALFRDGRRAAGHEAAALERALDRAEWRIASRGEAADRSGDAGDVDAATAMGDLGPWGEAAA